MCMFVEVTERSIVLDNGQELSCGMVVWSTGVAPRSAVTRVYVRQQFTEVATTGTLFGI